MLSADRSGFKPGGEDTQPENPWGFAAGPLKGYPKLGKKFENNCTHAFSLFSRSPQSHCLNTTISISCLISTKVHKVWHVFKNRVTQLTS